MASELKPCPFCGSSDLETYYADIEGWIAHIKCIDCDDMIGPMSEFKYETQEEAYEDASKRWNTRPTPVATVSPDATGKCGELVTVKVEHRVHFGEDGNPTEWREGYGVGLYPQDPIVRVETRELVTRSQAVELLAAERAEKDELEAAWLEAEGIISDLKAELAEALRGNRYAQLERIAVQRAEKAEADNAALTARVKEYETGLVDFHREMSALEAKLAEKDARIKELEAALDSDPDGSGLWRFWSKKSIEANQQLRDKTKTVKALEAKLAAAEKALEPFAAVLQDYDPDWEDDDVTVVLVVGSVTHYGITLGDLRRARAALGGTE